MSKSTNNISKKLKIINFKLFFCFNLLLFILIIYKGILLANCLISLINFFIKIKRFFINYLIKFLFNNS